MKAFIQTLIISEPRRNFELTISFRENSGAISSSHVLYYNSICCDIAFYPSTGYFTFANISPENFVSFSCFFDKDTQAYIDMCALSERFHFSNN